MTASILSLHTVAQHLKTFREKRPLVHCMTNDVVQEITANVLLAAGASPLMTLTPEEVAEFAQIADALLINLGSPKKDTIAAMVKAAKAATQAGTPWVLDPVAAGTVPWRVTITNELLALHPDVIRCNASELLAVAGKGAGGKGVDSMDTTEAALQTAEDFAKSEGIIICMTGETDYITDGFTTHACVGGTDLVTKVVGTGCALSALVAAYASLGVNVETVATACMLAKEANAWASHHAATPMLFKQLYIDRLYSQRHESLTIGDITSAN
ncbi:MAG: hydroxyethylthiazole kinase [Sutterella sp.]|nr:hydroxyethylthiazole kinase [Sutterella sp.]